MTPFQLILSLVLALMMFAVALHLRWADFALVARMPRAVVAGLIPEFLLLPAATWALTMVLDLPANIELAMLLVAACPGGNVSNVVTHFARGNAALSVTLTAVASAAAVVMLPLNFAWTAAANPETARLLVALAVDQQLLWLNLLAMLGVPMVLGLWLGARRPQLAQRLQKPLGRMALGMLLVFIVAGLVGQRQLLTLALLPTFALVVAHNLLGLGVGWLSARLFRVGWAERRTITIEVGMQNSALALAVIASQFQNDLGMVIIASLWGIWHIVSGLLLAAVWRRQFPAIA